MVVVVDGSDLTCDQRWQLLRASVVIEGRSVTVTLYEEAHPQFRLGNLNVRSSPVFGSVQNFSHF